MEVLKKVVRLLGMDDTIRKFLHSIIFKNWFLKYYLTRDKEKYFTSGDPVRYGSIMLAVETIKRNSIPGVFAELGVYRGETSKIIHELAPEKTFYLFDTFEGFHQNDLNGKEDDRFKDTDIELVKRNLGNPDNIIFKKGYFPETANDLDEKLFSFVMLDVDLYQPTMEGLKFFYTKMAEGGYIFVHDYNSPESDFSVSKAVNEFMKDKPEKVVEIPDVGGSIIIRKC